MPNSRCKFQVAILLANGMVYEALQFQRQRSGGGGGFGLCTLGGSGVGGVPCSYGPGGPAVLSYFFERAMELGKLDTVLQLSLTQVCEEIFRLKVAF